LDERRKQRSSLRTAVHLERRRGCGEIRVIRGHHEPGGICSRLTRVVVGVEALAQQSLNRGTRLPAKFALGDSRQDKASRARRLLIEPPQMKLARSRTRTGLQHLVLIACARQVDRVWKTPRE